MTSRRPLAILVGLPATLLAGACSGPQSILAPGGLEAGWIAELWWWMFAVLTVVFLGYCALLAVAIFPRWFGLDDRPRALDETKLLLGAGVLLPVVVLVALTLATSLVGGAVAPPPEGDDHLTIEVTARQFWWEVRYPGDGPADSFTTANEIHVPVGVPVLVVLRSADVLHSFWVPALNGKIDAVPGQTNHLRMTATEAGTFRGQCSQFCGMQHANMAFHVVASPPEEFEAWRRDQLEPARVPEDPVLSYGEQLFLEGGCAFCHQVRGIGGPGGPVSPSRVGPDLTHLASRGTIGAGLLPNHQGTLQAWIVGNQALKPGNHMPEFDHFDGEELRALGAYLESLE